MTDEITINSELTRLRAEYPILGDHMPLAIGIRAELKPLINLNSRNSHKLIYLTSNSFKYTAGCQGETTF